MASRKNQIGQSGVGRQISQHRGDRPGRQSAALGATDISTGSNLRVNKKGQLVVKKARVVAPVRTENVTALTSVLNDLIVALQDARLMER